MLKKVLTFIIISILIFSSGCSNNELMKYDSDLTSSKLQVYTSFYPLYFAVQEISKGKVDLYSVIPNGVEPHDYEPTIREISRIEDADLFVYNGIGMEPWGDKLSETLEAQNIPVINASEHVKLIEIDSDVHHDEQNSDAEDHNQGIYDPHIWLNPLNMDKIGYEIKEQLSSIDTDNRGYYEKNYEEFSKKLKALDNKYNNDLDNKNRDAILVSHEAFRYLSDRYGFNQIAVSGINPHEEPTPKTLANLIDLAIDEDFRYIFLEVLASPKSTETLAKEANLKILVLNPVSGLTEEQQKNDENYFTLMEQNLDNLKKELVR